MFRAVAWIGPMIMLLGEAIGSGELLVEPIAGARFGATLFWVIIFIIVTKALWNETIGRTALRAGQQRMADDCRSRRHRHGRLRYRPLQRLDGRTAHGAL